MASNMRNGNTQLIWLGVATGAAIGIGLALSRRKRSGWETARAVSRRMADRSGDFADATKDIVERVKTIFDEGRRVVADATELWEHGRRVVRT